MKTFKRPLWTAVLLASIVCLGVAGTKISRLTQTRTFQPNSLFLVVTGSAANGTLATRHIEATNLLDGLTNLPNWPTTGQASVTNAIGTVRTNGTAVSTAATSFDIITGSNTLVLATNSGGAVTVQINATGGGSVAQSDINSSSNALYGIETTRNAAVSNAVIAEIITASNSVYSTETTRNAAVSNANWAWTTAISNYVDTASSNRVRLTGGTGGITVSQSGSGGVQTWTINDDDAGGGSTTNFNTLGVGSITVGTVIASNLVRAGRMDVLTNLNAGTLTATNWAQISGPQTNSGAIYATSTASFDGTVSLGADLNVPSGTIGASSLTVSSTFENAGRNVENIDKTGTSVSVAIGAGPHYSIQTNTAPTFTFSGTPIHGQRLSITVSNTSTAQFTVGFPTAYSVQVRSNVTGWACAASNYVILPFIRTTNEIGGGIWLLDHVSEMEASLAVASAGANGFLALSTNAGGNIVTVSNAYIPQASSMVLSNLVSGPAAITNGLVAGWGVAVVTNSGVISTVLTNRPASIATNATSVTLDFSDTANIQVLNAWFHLTTNLVVSPTNLVVGRTMAVYFDTNALTYDVTFTNTAANRINWNFNVATNGSTSFTKTNTMRARVFLTAETNGVISAEMGYYR